MSQINKIKKQGWYHRLAEIYYSSVYACFYKLVTLISPKWNVCLHYRRIKGHFPNLENPTTFHEKLLKLKIEKYNDSALVKKCADKYAVRQYVTETVTNGEELLIPLIATYYSVDDIQWDSFPDKFVIKWNFGCGFNIVCQDKSKLDITKAKTQLKKWENDTTYLLNAELQYKNVKKVIMVEEFLDDHTGDLPSDYKFYCFNGNPMAVLYISGRDSSEESAAFFDMEWNYIGRPQKACYIENTHLPEKPESLERMIDAAQQLSSNFEFVRVDFYVVNNKPYLGEMTFTPASGLYTSECEIGGKSMGELLRID